MKQYLKKQSKWTEISKKLIGRNIYAFKNRIQCLCNKFGIQKTTKAMEENFRKVVEEMETCKKKVHRDKSDSHIKNIQNISVSNIFFPELREKAVF